MNRNYSNSVTINNSKMQSVHTWLVFKTGEHFSFNPPNLKCAVSCDCNGILESDEIVRKRIPDGTKIIDITKQQFETMMDKVLEFYSNQHTYALIPLQMGEYNCVSASRVVLQAGGIHFLDDVITPMGVSSKIRGSPLYLDDDRIWQMNGTIPRITDIAVTSVTGRGLSEGGPASWILGAAFGFGLIYLFSYRH